MEAAAAEAATAEAVVVAEAGWAATEAEQEATAASVETA